MARKIGTGVAFEVSAWRIGPRKWSVSMDGLVIARGRSFGRNRAMTHATNFVMAKALIELQRDALMSQDILTRIEFSTSELAAALKQPTGD